MRTDVRHEALEQALREPARRLELEAERGPGLEERVVERAELSVRALHELEPEGEHRRVGVALADLRAHELAEHACVDCGTRDEHVDAWGRHLLVRRDRQRLARGEDVERIEVRRRVADPPEARRVTVEAPRQQIQAVRVGRRELEDTRRGRRLAQVEQRMDTRRVRRRRSPPASCGICCGESIIRPPSGGCSSPARRCSRGSMFASSRRRAWSVWSSAALDRAVVARLGVAEHLERRLDLGADRVEQVVEDGLVDLQRGDPHRHDAIARPTRTARSGRAAPTRTRLGPVRARRPTQSRPDRAGPRSRRSPARCPSFSSSVVDRLLAVGEVQPDHDREASP